MDIRIVERLSVDGVESYYLEHDFDLLGLGDAPDVGPYLDRATAERAADHLSALLAA